MLKSVYEQINVQIRGLAAIFVNTDYYVRLLIPVIMSKFPQWHEVKEAKGEVNKDKLMGVIKQEVEAREACESWLNFNCSQWGLVPRWSEQQGPLTNYVHK